MSSKVITIERHIIEGERQHPGATGNFSALLRDLTLAVKVIWREVSKAGLVNIIGPAVFWKIYRVDGSGYPSHLALRRHIFVPWRRSVSSWKTPIDVRSQSDGVYHGTGGGCGD